MTGKSDAAGSQTDPMVSVIIPTYLHADFVLHTLESVFAQTWTNFEVIVVNDGSPDRTAQLLQTLVERGQLRYFEQPNAGQAAARNRGLAEARGELIAFLDDDDLWPADHLQWQVDEMVRDPALALVYGFSESFGGIEPPTRFPGPEAPSGDVFARFAESAWMRSPGQALIRRWALNRVGGFDPSIWGTDDWDLYLRLASRGPFLYRDRRALRYRMHSTNASLRFDRMYRNGCRVARKNFKGDSGPMKNLRKTAVACAREFSCNEGLRLAVRQRSAGQRVALLATLGKLLRIKPGLWQDREMLGHLVWAFTPPSLFRMIRRRRLG